MDTQFEADEPFPRERDRVIFLALNKMSTKKIYVNDCVFCKIISGELSGSFVYQDNICSAFLDINPINSGHVLIVPNSHSKSLSDMSDEDAGQLLKVGKAVYSAIKKSSLKCEGANFMISDGKPAGQDVFHTHLHVIPRFLGDKQRVGFSHSSSDSESLNLIAAELRGLI